MNNDDFFENEIFPPFDDRERPDQIIENEEDDPHETRPDACDSFEDERTKKHSKGFYATFAICLAAVAATALITFNNVSDYISPDPVDTTKSTVSVTAPAATKEQEAGVDVTGVPDERPTVEDETEAPVNAIKEKTTGEPKVYVRPTGKEILNPFSGEVPVYSKTFGDYRTHNGTDYKAKQGSEVKSIASGVVSEVRIDDIFDTVVVVDHGSGIIAYYCGVSPKETIQAGSNLSEGDVIGTLTEILGESAEQSHFHFEVKKNGNYVDPETLF